MSAAITREIKAGRCACDLKNPSGRCFLGELRAYEKCVGRRRAADPSGRHLASKRRDLTFLSARSPAMNSASITEIADLNQLRARFNADRNVPRLLLLLSPT